MVDKSPRQAFFHLRLHSEFSINDGLVTITSLIEKLKYFGMPAVAITDFANLFALIKFYSAAIKSGIKPICGCDVLVENCDGVRSKIVLLASNNIGYLNLTSLISGIYTEASDARETVISQSKLNKHTEGLIALSGAQYSDVGVALMEGNLEQAEKYLQVWKTMFPNAFYLEVQRLDKVGEEQYIAGLIELAIESRTPVVATNDVRFISQDDFEAHEVRVCINEGRTLDDPRRTRNFTAQQYLKSSSEMSQLFCDLPAAIANTVEIIKRCNLELKLGTPHLPRYPVPEGETLENYLSELSQNGLKKRFQHLYGDESKTEEILIPYRKRLNQEIEIINRMGFAGYFLIVMEFIQWAKSAEIPVGPGRGSGAGSLVAYALEITDLDPLKYDLLFERFLNPERVSMPDFDIDFCMEGRDRVINHVAELYGKEAVSQIVTFGTMAAKAVVRDVARVQGKPYALADKLSKLIPFEPGMTLSKAFAQEKSLVAFVENDEDAQEIIEMAHKLEGITRNVGKHAGGVVIAPTKLTDFTPLYSDESGQGLVTQFDKNDVETAGLVKFDFLGLRTLTIIDWAVKMINQQRSQEQEPIDINALPLDDESVYELLQSGQTTAVFQLESFGMKELIKRLAPSCFEDIIALVALFRPGPLRSGMDKEFIDRKHGRARVEYLHPELESVLSDTYGVILYQEQVMQIAQVLANYTLGSADILRKAMGKKDEKEMSKNATISYLDPSAPNARLVPAQLNAVYGLALRLAQNHAYSRDRSEDHVTGHVNFQWDVNDATMVYLEMGNGYKAGGFDEDNGMGRELETVNGITDDLADFEDENVETIEIGAKIDLADGRGRLNISAFSSTYEDVQVSTFDGTAGFIVGNAAESEVQGIETDIYYRATEEITFNGAFAYMDAIYKSFPGAGCNVAQAIANGGPAGCTQDLSGQQLQFAPELTANIGISYDTQLTSGLLLNVALDYNWTDDVIVAADMDENLIQESYGKLNARISLAKSDQWQIALIGKNLTDEKTFMWGNDIPLGSLGFNGAYFKMIDPPRTVELTARINF